MTLADAVLAALPGLRAEADALLFETGTFFYETLSDPPEGQIDPVKTKVIVHADVPSRLKSHTIQVSDREAAGQLVGVQQLMVKVAVGSTPNVREGHLYEVTASRVDPSLVGRVVRVTGEPQGGTVSNHRYPVEET